MYLIHASLPYGVTADCRCATLEQLVEYLVAWLPLSSKVVCEETIPDEELFLAIKRTAAFNLLAAQRQAESDG